MPNPVRGVLSPRLPNHSLPTPHTSAATTVPRYCDMPLYRPGVPAIWQGVTMTISHVLLSKGRMLVYLEGHPAALDPAALQVPPTRLVLQRS